jgi:hypothetical protein
MNIDKTFPLKLCVNGSLREEQRFRMDLEFYKLGWDVRRVRAPAVRLVKRRRGHLTAEGYAATLGHRLALRLARQAGAEAVLIFEDDVEFHPLFKEKLEQISLPDDWEVLLLGAVHHIAPELAGPCLARVARSSGRHAWAVRACAYDRILQYLRRGIPRDADDEPWNEVSGIACYAALPNLAWTQPRFINSKTNSGHSTIVRRFDEMGRQARSVPGLKEVERAATAECPAKPEAKSAERTWASRKNLVVKLSGGLGNQMFQYAFARALSQETGAKVMLLGDGLASGATPREFRLNLYGLEQNQWPGGSRTTLTHWENTGEEWWMTGLKALTASAAENVVLEGNWQNPNLFGPHAASIREVFRLRPERMPETVGKAPVCLQVRRGDFVTDERFDVCRAEYFSDAMKVVRGLIKRPHFIVVTDDLDWCHTWLKGTQDITFYGSHGEERDQRVMQGCEAFIISNSTYGWWPAWITGAKVVVRPNIWTWDKPDWNIWPASWICMPSTGVFCAPT